MFSKVAVALLLLSGASAFTPIGLPSARVARTVVSSTGTGPSLDYNPDKYTDEANAGNFRRMSAALADGDIERKKQEEEQRQREMAAQLAREERARKIKFLYELPADTPAGE